jgi:hypothetical protein
VPGLCEDGNEPSGSIKSEGMRMEEVVTYFKLP